MCSDSTATKVRLWQPIRTQATTNEVTKDKHVAVLLSMIGGGTNVLLRNLLAPSMPKEKTLANIYIYIYIYTKEVFEPHLLSFVEISVALKNQQLDESVTNFVAELRRLPQECEFWDHEALSDHVVSGLQKEATQ